jgi:putative transposase
MGRPHKFIQLEQIEREFLQSLVRKGESRAIELNRAWMLLWNDANVKSNEIAQRLSMGYVTVTQTLKQYRDEGLESALYDAHRSGAPRKITPELEAHISSIACSKCAEGNAKWTIDLLKDEVIRLNITDSISRSSVHTVLKKVNLNLGNIECGA